ncbi:ABC transporter substrate-binding protein [Saccharomonospora viridis]|jgi:putative spermidine/putrescine transport system substrate-binding protein|uniref:ABC transporter substrate-binding protein n=1 Tax=Saccharomonospora viridis TaxID=1852 RepID=A0A837D8N1_9PSEU|nr:extracellular solute-binding protein [Saccharomonospora viridis]KHF43997.1 ABC transporter substrate-binding protein [Saccharomonospora viridis]SFP90003.1 putative spermidine/putrescine transport system substrate-binding protein [Saccharomonospora viridis]
MRRNVVVGALAAALLAASCSPPESPGPQRAAGPIPDKPAKPVTLNILDVAGNLQLTQGMIDQFVAEHPDIISEVTYSSAPAPDLIGKVKSQQNAGRVDIGLVLTGVDGMSAGIEQGLWEEVLPKHADRLPGMKDYLEPAAEMQKLAQGYGVTVTYYPSGPLIEYLPSRVPNPPRTAQELLDYAKAHPGKVEYARPSNSGPGRTFLMGLPYILGDSDPRDPVHGWEKTWDYLAELNSYIDRYPSGTTQTMTDLANGTVDIVVTTTGWDINPRALGTVPAEAEIGTLEGFHWVTDAHYAVIPKGATADQQAAALQLIQFMLTKEQQAKAYDEGYFYPGPAVKGVDISMAPESSQEVIRRYGRPEYDQLIADHPKETPLDAKTMVAAFDRWDREIGGAKVDQ